MDARPCFHISHPFKMPHFSSLLNATFVLLPGPEVNKRFFIFSCSFQLSMEFFLLINVEMPTFVGISTLWAGKIAFLASLSLKNAQFIDIFILMSTLNFMLG